MSCVRRMILFIPLLCIATQPTALQAATPDLHTLTPQSDGSVRAAWSGDASGWTLERSTDNRSYTAVTTVDGSGSATDDGVAPGTLYIYRLRQQGWTSNWNYVFTPAAIDADEPPRPAQVAARWTAADTAMISWVDHIGDESGYEVAAKGPDDGDFVVLGTTAADATGYIHTGADWHEQWTYRVRAVAGGSAGPWSAAVPALYHGDYGYYKFSSGEEYIIGTSTVATGVNAVQSPAATAVHSSRIDLSWDALAGAEGYMILRSWDGVRWVEIDSVADDVTSYQHNGVLLPGVERSYRICATVSGKAGKWSSKISIAPSAFAADLPAPSDILAVADGDDISVTWTDTASDETGFAIERAGRSSPDFVRIATVAAGTTSYRHVDASRYARYRVQALRGTDVGPYGPVAVVGELIYAGATGLTASWNDSEDAVDISWTLPAEGYPNGFAIERSVDGAAFSAAGWIAGHETTAWRDREPPRGTTCAYRVRTTGYVSAWELSGTDTVAIPTADAMPATPTELAATPAARDQINLAWADMASTETGYVVERGPSGGPYAVLANLPADCRSYSDSGLDSGTTYAYRVYAVNDLGAGDAVSVEASPDSSDPDVTASTLDVGALRRALITGTAANDDITLSQSGDDLLVTRSDASVLTLTGPFDEFVVHAGGGDDSVTIAAGVAVRGTVHAGPGADELRVQTTQRCILVAVGGGADTLIGNGQNTSFWCDPEHLDAITASQVERRAGRVHRIDNFYQPTTFDRSSSDYVDNEPDAASWDDPSWWGTDDAVRYPEHSLWGRNGPVMFDVNQGEEQNCGDTAFYQLAADRRPELLEECLCDLGDGTYAYRLSGAVDRYARLDADVTPEHASALGPAGSLWWLIAEKGEFAYDLPALLDHVGSFERRSMGTADHDLYTRVRAALDRCELVRLRHAGKADAGAPLVRQGHAYGIVEAYRAADGEPRYILRNPYGSHDGWKDNNDLIAPLYLQGLVTLTGEQMEANFPAGQITILPGASRSIVLDRIDDETWEIDPPVALPRESATTIGFDHLDERQDHRLSPLDPGNG